MLKNIEETKWPLKVLSEDKKEQNRKDLEVKMEEPKLKFGKIARSLRAVADKLDQVWWNCKLAYVGGTLQFLNITFREFDINGRNKPSNKQT